MTAAGWSEKRRLSRDSSILQGETPLYRQNEIVDNRWNAAYLVCALWCSTTLYIAIHIFVSDSRVINWKICCFRCWRHKSLVLAFSCQQAHIVWWVKLSWLEVYIWICLTFFRSSFIALYVFELALLVVTKWESEFYSFFCWVDKSLWRPRMSN